ncbi:MAG: hypothetical protein ACRECH_08685 [Nitrososphaerales archaeon]
MLRSPLISLFGILTAAWLLILVGVVVIFNYIVPFSYFHSYADSVAKGGFGTIVSLLWLFAMVKMRDYFVRTRILRNQTVTSEKSS